MTHTLTDEDVQKIREALQAAKTLRDTFGGNVGGGRDIFKDALAPLSASQPTAPAGGVSLEEKHPQETGVLPDWMRVKNAMKLVWEHKCKGAYNLSDKTWDILAETATKTMWLIEEENERKNKP